MNRRGFFAALLAAPLTALLPKSKPPLPLASSIRSFHGGHIVYMDTDSVVFSDSMDINSKYPAAMYFPQGMSAAQIEQAFGRVHRHRDGRVTFGMKVELNRLYGKHAS